MDANMQCLIWKLMGHGIFFFYHLRLFATPLGLLLPCIFPCPSFTTFHMAEDAYCIRCSKFMDNLIKCCCVLAGQTERCHGTSWMSWMCSMNSGLHLIIQRLFYLRQEYKWKGTQAVQAFNPIWMWHYQGYMMGCRVVNVKLSGRITPWCCSYALLFNDGCSSLASFIFLTICLLWLRWLRISSDIVGCRWKSLCIVHYVLNICFTLSSKQMEIFKVIFMSGQENTWRNFKFRYKHWALSKH